MTLGTSLFQVLNSRAFNRLDTQISSLQEDVARGTKDPRSSADPVRAQRLSVAKEQKDMLDRFEGNLIIAEKRLSLTDDTLGDTIDILQYLRTMSVRAADANVTPDERVALVLEASEYREALISQANLRDDTGRPLFGGFKGRSDPFVDSDAGVQYTGDGGKHTLRVSESASVATGVDGNQTFMSVPTRSGEVRSLFTIVDDFIHALKSNETLYDKVSTEGDVEMHLQATKGKSDWSFTFGEGDAAVTVSAELVNGQPGPAIAAINEVSSQTGVTAAFSEDGKGLVLSGPSGVNLSGLRVSPEVSGDLAVVKRDDETVRMVAPGRTQTGMIDDITSTSSHIANMRAIVGSQGQSVDRYQALVTDRRVIMDEAISGLQDLDIAEAITKMQSLLTTRDASQSSFVKISQKSLFDYIR
ncbi:flagellar hook-associated protein FlgL [Donghicola sp. C2-DW-16]|uniref:Flagellar hook-associated protein FlgL n=1 Tax=Donghicola mangrovi TaxID=2729614 RepID=A0A850Q6B6_9RHOB|nr:flagellar hook-associated protein FlgL [Donghicola mangrovi]NVO22095.1 flagellar hook-associated protein FlgL [Donghicola mangrovi]NVO26314.1 flagellar hook-associated protein FlgL [Donghicola mangrovi]